MAANPLQETVSRYPGAEPLPGYRLLQLLGRGGFGEVWRCEAPGGLQKAIKFVVCGGEKFDREVEAFEQVKTIRHPFLLTLERVEAIGGNLIMVMELADCQLHDHFTQCQTLGLRGIPRVEFLGYLKEAAEALDMMAAKHGLQHLDVKPENLFIVSGHLKVGDFGLVRAMEEVKNRDSENRGFTPRYSAPEVLRGSVDETSDQYSLALVYVELLTGVFPFSGRTAQQLMVQHVNNAPDLTMLSFDDRFVVGRALSKNPAERFESCLAFVRALASCEEDELPSVATAYSGGDCETRLGRFRVGEEHAEDSDNTAVVASQNAPPERYGSALATRDSDRRRGRRRQMERAEAKAPSEAIELIVSVDRLHGMPASMARFVTKNADEYMLALIDAAERACLLNGTIARADGLGSCRFLSTIPPALVPLKLAIVAETWGLKLDERDPTNLVLRWDSPRQKPTQPPKGYRIELRLPTPPDRELTAIGSLFGDADEQLAEMAHLDVPAILEMIRNHLQNQDERRVHPRYDVDYPILVYPRYSDGVVGDPVLGQCLDVSVGGVRFLTLVPIRTERLYVEFKDVEPVDGLAIIVHVIRTAQDVEGSVTVAKFGLPPLKVPT